MITLTSYIYSQNQYNQYGMHPSILIECLFFLSSSLFSSPFISSYFFNMVKRVLGSLDLNYIQQILFTVKLLNAQLLVAYCFFFYLIIWILHTSHIKVVQQWWKSIGSFLTCLYFRSGSHTCSWEQSEGGGGGATQHPTVPAAVDWWEISGWCHCCSQQAEECRRRDHCYRWELF